jgi:hypothetical protein
MLPLREGAAVSAEGAAPELVGDELSPAELAFRDLMSRLAAYSAWAAGVRASWEYENVVWCHGYRDGKPVWRRERPPPEAPPPKRVDAAKTAPRYQHERSHARPAPAGQPSNQTRGGKT